MAKRCKPKSTLELLQQKEVVLCNDAEILEVRELTPEDLAKLNTKGSTNEAAWTFVLIIAVIALLERSIDRAERPNVPKGLLIDLCMPPERAEDALYNMLGRYDYWVSKHGRRAARLIFFTQSIGSVLSFWTDWLLQRTNLLRFLRRS